MIAPEIPNTPSLLGFPSGVETLFGRVMLVGAAFLTIYVLRPLRVSASTRQCVRSSGTDFVGTRPSWP